MTSLKLIRIRIPHIAERVQRDKDLQAAVQQEEEDLRKEMEAMKIRHAEEAAATPFHAGATVS